MIDDFKELKETIENFLALLDYYDLELNDDGDIVDKKSKKLLWEITHGISEDE